MSILHGASRRLGKFVVSFFDLGGPTLGPNANGYLAALISGPSFLLHTTLIKASAGHTTFEHTTTARHATTGHTTAGHTTAAHAVLARAAASRK